jgi:transcriptional regulator with XRE-family HTH domain
MRRVTGMAMNEVVVLRDRDVLRAAMKERGMTQLSVAQKLGMLPNALSQNMNRNHISMDKFKAILDAMDYDVYIVDRNNKEAKWCVDVEDW